VLSRSVSLRLYLVSYERRCFIAKATRVLPVVLRYHLFILALGLRYLYRLKYFHQLSRVALAVYILFISMTLAIIDISLTFTFSLPAS
jgi:hypothetical protein